MYSLITVLAWCFISMLVGVVAALCIVLYLVDTHREYEEPDDWPDEEWAKTYEEIKNESSEVH